MVSPTRQPKNNQQPQTNLPTTTLKFPKFPDIPAPIATNTLYTHEEPFRFLSRSAKHVSHRKHQSQLSTSTANHIADHNHRWKEDTSEMIKIFDGIRKNFKIRPPRYTIDNWIFRLHYRLTSLFYLVASVLVSSREYVGEHIRCISDSGVPEHIMDRFCFITSTFTVVKHLDGSAVEDGRVVSAGVGPLVEGDEVKRHNYYQWVPFVLFGQAMAFYFPHFFWKALEGRKLRRLVEGLHNASFALLDKEIEVRDVIIPSRRERDQRVKIIKRAFIERLYIGKEWSRGLISCEILNLINTVLQIYFTNSFLGGQFLYLGSNVVEKGFEDAVDPLEVVFPKVTKCTFYKYGPSGSLQTHDAMCVMALNIINEKVYVFFWFWLFVLLVLSTVAILWRLLTFLLHARSSRFNEMVFAHVCPGELNPWRMLTVTNHCSYTDWLFLRYLSRNMDGLLFRELLVGIAEEMSEAELEKLRERRRKVAEELM